MMHRHFHAVLCVVIGFATSNASSQTSANPQFVTANPLLPLPNVTGQLMGVADFNGDGRPDVLSSIGSDFVVLLENANGTFTQKNTTIAPGVTTAIADVNGDGKPDIITIFASPTNCGDPNVPSCGDTGPAVLSVAFGNGDGSFTQQPTVNLNDGSGALSLIVADLNGDGSPDLAVAIGDSTANPLEVLLNNGKGVFSAAPGTQSTINVQLLTSGDFRGDGMIDLAGGGSTLGTLLILKNSGNGVFTVANTYSGLPAGAAAAADFNRDGHLDLVIAEGNNLVPSVKESAAVLMGNGDDSFKTPLAVSASLSTAARNSQTIIPVAVTVDDFNHDGYPDFALSYRNLANAAVAIFTNSGTGTFGSPRVYDMGYGYPNGFAIADFNGDGNADLIAAPNEGSGSSPFTIAFGDKAGNFAAPVFTLSGGASAVTTADFNGDGIADVAIVNQASCATTCGNGTVTVFTGSGQGYFNQGKTYNLNFPIGNIAAGDVNGDHHVDLVVTRENFQNADGTATIPAGDMAVLLGNGDGTFDAPVFDDILGSPHAGTTNTQTYLVDVNHDGKLDLIGDWGVALGNGDGSFGSPTHFPSSVNAISGIVIGDFNRDGNTDIVVAQSGRVNGQTIPAVIYTLLGNGKGAFPISSQEQLNYSLPTILGITTADLNGDGKLDLAYVYLALPAGASEYNRLLVQMGNGDGTFATAVPTSLPLYYNAATTLAAADFNRDGYMDLLIAAPFPGGGVGLLPGSAGGKFTAPLQYYQGEASTGAVLDLNHDGAPDFVGLTPIGAFRMLNTGHR